MLSVTVDLTQLHVMGALGALGGIVKDGSLWQNKISGSKYKPEEDISSVFKMAAYEGA